MRGFWASMDRGERAWLYANLGVIALGIAAIWIAP